MEKSSNATHNTIQNIHVTLSKLDEEERTLSFAVQFFILIPKASLFALFLCSSWVIQKDLYAVAERKWTFLVSCRRKRATHLQYMWKLLLQKGDASLLGALNCLKSFSCSRNFHALSLVYHNMIPLKFHQNRCAHPVTRIICDVDGMPTLLKVQMEVFTWCDQIVGLFADDFLAEALRSICLWLLRIA